MPISRGKGSGLWKPGKQVVDQGWRNSLLQGMDYNSPLQGCHLSGVWSVEEPLFSSFLLLRNSNWYHNRDHAHYMCNVFYTDNLLHWFADWDRWVKLTHLSKGSPTFGLLSWAVDILHIAIWSAVTKHSGENTGTEGSAMFLISLQGRGIYQDCKVRLAKKITFCDRLFLQNFAQFLPSRAWGREKRGPFLLQLFAI